MNRSHVLALAAGVLGLVVGRSMPRDSAGHDRTGPVASASPVVTAPVDCKAERAQLASTRTQLAICMAFQARSAEPEPAPPSPTLAASTSPDTSPGGLEDLAAEARKFRERDARYREAVYVRHKGGKAEIYRPDEWPPDGEDVYARKLLDGTILWYAGPDAGPRSDPNAWVSKLSDLSGPDGVLPGTGRTSLKFMKPDAGAP